MSDRLIQYIVVRSDLKASWPLGALIAQGAHASVAAIAKTQSNTDTVAYLSDLENMTKCVLGIESVDALRDLSTSLSNAKVDHHLWVEQPENAAVALATAPARKSSVVPFFRGLKIFK